MGDGMERKPFDLSYYENDTEYVAKDLLGCQLIHYTSEGPTGGIIVETEAYLGKDDPACHSARGKTKRNETMFKGPGFSYVYLIYGIHYCYNVTTGPIDRPEAVLIRALEPKIGIELMQRRRNQNNFRNLCSGPGKLTQALGIDLSVDGERVDTGPVRIYPSNLQKKQEIVTTTRIGISVACDWPLRYYIKGNKFISKK
ncbi:MAG: DNA-3-methyladenine glycosylase [Clostridia bacterium]|jgi:DNA-3-methyladenine glycosylase|nr:DNA-3-methyladenine glycosylase [Clostridia bacterium]